MARIFAAVFLLTSALALAQEPKAAPKVKFTPGQIADAQAKLVAAKCTLNRPEAHREDWEAFLRKPAEPQAAVDLVGFPNDTSDADLAKLLPHAKRLPALKAIMLWNTDKVTAKGLKLLAKELPDLQGIILTNVSIADRDFGEFVALRSLTWMEINDTPIRDAAMAEIAMIPKLANLTLNGTRFVSPRGIDSLQKASRLTELNMDISADRLPLATAIGKLAALTRIHVYPAGDDEAEELGKLKELTHLDLTQVVETAKMTPWEQRARRFGQVSDSGLKHFMGCKSLTSIRVSGSVRLSGVPELAKLEGLSELDVASTSVNDEGLNVVRKCKALTKLDLSFTQVTDEGVRELADLPRLEVLTLDDVPKLTDKSLEALGQVRTLKSLSMDGTRVSATECRSLSYLTALRHLSLKATDVSPNSFTILGAAKSLQALDLRENCPHLGSRDIGPLQGMLPKTKILAYSCSGIGWLGSYGYSFKLPEVKSPPVRSNPVTPPRTALTPPKVPVPMAPPKVAPPATKTGGGSPKG